MFIRIEKLSNFQVKQRLLSIIRLMLIIAVHKMNYKKMSLKTAANTKRSTVSIKVLKGHLSWKIGYGDSSVLNLRIA